MTSGLLPSPGQDSPELGCGGDQQVLLMMRAALRPGQAHTERLAAVASTAQPASRYFERRHLSSTAADASPRPSSALASAKSPRVPVSAGLATGEARADGGQLRSAHASREIARARGRGHRQADLAWRPRRGRHVAGPARRLEPLHPRNNTFPGEVFLRLAADALAWSGVSTADPLPLEGIRERFLPEFSGRGRDGRKFQYAVLAAAALHGDAEPDLLDEVTGGRPTISGSTRSSPLSPTSAPPLTGRACRYAKHAAYCPDGHAGRLADLCACTTWPPDAAPSCRPLCVAILAGE